MGLKADFHKYIARFEETSKYRPYRLSVPISSILDITIIYIYIQY